MDYKQYNDYELFYLIYENHDLAKEILFNKYKPMINRTVNKYKNFAKNHGLSEDDLYQEGIIGLYLAVKRYNEYKNNLFYTYARHLIEGSIYNAVRKNSNNSNRILSDAYSFTQEDYSLLDILPSSFSIEDLTKYEERYQELKKFLVNQTPINSQVFELKINGFTTKEISLFLEIEPKKVSNIVYNMRKKIKEHFDNCDFFIE